ncbi:hypothetical protein [Streptomyces sp. PSAA01]|uniref:hypothetical protein n=1 Tax=Streptomyces sp. PSAA01 TaxID=2912762 RepID=UPI001F3BB6D4|nr:hypothetical protein [Streptomyces sp. PSAA01]MCG0289031.1 hypothetical protein [Streptomyces sp. PSAA01]
MNRRTGTRRRAALTLISAPLLAFVLAACGSGSGGEGGGDDDGGGSSQTSDGQIQGGDDDAAPGKDLLAAAERYAKCLRENGFPQAEVDEQRGGLRLDAGLPPTEAVEECRQYNPAGPNGPNEIGN